MNRIVFPCLIMLAVGAHAQPYEFAPSKNYPYGRPNPSAPEQIQDFAEMIGTCQCRSVARINQQSWGDTVAMQWTFRYIMNGMAVQDETYKADGLHSGSIRQFNVDSSRWYVHYYAVASKTPVLPAWQGNRSGDKIILVRDQPSPNGIPGYYRITFYDISAQGYNWAGEWVSQDGTFVYPTWYIYCKRGSSM